MPKRLLITTLASPDGPYHLAVSERGVVAAQTGGALDDFRDRISEWAGGLIDATDAEHAVFDRLRPAIEAILAGDERDSTGIALDLTDRSPFDRAILEAVRGVAWGETASYGEIARRSGSPRAARAAGAALARWPYVGTLIPYHRVIAADGTLGGYGGDGPVDRRAALDEKRARLLREGVTVRERDG